MIFICPSTLERMRLLVYSPSSVRWVSIDFIQISSSDLCDRRRVQMYKSVNADEFDPQKSTQTSTLDFIQLLSCLQLNMTELQRGKTILSRPL